MRKISGTTILVVVMIVVIGFLAYATTQRVPNADKYDVTRLYNKTKGHQMTVRTYSENGQIVDEVFGKGLNVTEADTGNLSGGKQHRVAAIKVRLGNNQIATSGSLMVAYNTHMYEIIGDYLRTQDFRQNPTQGPLLNQIVKSLPDSQKYKQAVLIIRTHSGNPVVAFTGNSIKPFYTNMESSQVFTVDGKLVFVYEGAYTIDDLALFY